MKHLLALAFITLFALGTGCAWISPSSQTTSSDGIQVHGHWTMTVSNPDGTIDSVQEFSNDLQPANSERSGADLLTALLTGETAITGWSVYIFGSGGIDCQEDPDPGFNGRYRDATFTRDVSVGTPLRLTTTCTMALSDTTSTTQISSVSAEAYVSPMGYPTYGSSGANTMLSGVSRHRFTTKTIPNADRVDIKHNQLVSVNVVISFN